MPRHNGGGRVGQIASGSVFVGIHVAAVVGIFFTGVDRASILLAVALYWARMFVVTAGYHRYFSHRSYKTSRAMQFILGFLGTACVQKGPLWWASTHRKHHKYSDTPLDVHSPRQRGFWYSHMGWIMSTEHTETDFANIKDLAKYPELMWLNRYHFVAPVLLALGCYAWMGWRGLIVGFAVSTVVLAHSTFTINSLSHVFGRRRYVTTDDSRNNWALALLTMGEGWHNNHHHYQASARQGFFWWEVDASYYILKAMATVGLVRDLKAPPQHVLDNTDEEVAEVQPVLAAARTTVAGHYEAARHAVHEQLEAAHKRLSAEYEAAKAALAEKYDATRARIVERYASALASIEATKARIAVELDAAKAALASLEATPDGA